MDLANLTDTVSEDDIMMAAEQKFFNLYEDIDAGNLKFRSTTEERDYWAGKWMEILYELGKACPKSKDVIFESKMLFKKDEDAEDYPIYEDENSEEIAGNAFHYGKRLLHLRKLVNHDTGFLMVQDGYMSLAKEMRLNFSENSEHRLEANQIIGMVKDLAGTSSIDVYQAIFRNHEITDMFGFVEILKKSKKVTQVEVNVHFEGEKNHRLFRATCAQLMEVLQIESIKHVKFGFHVHMALTHDWNTHTSSLDLDFLESCLSVQKMGQVEQVKIFLKHTYSPMNCPDPYYFAHAKLFKYENLNKTSMTDFIRKFLGKKKT